MNLGPRYGQEDEDVADFPSNEIQKGAIPLGKYAALSLLTVLALFAAGCTVGPRYRKPVTAIQPFQNAPSIESRHAVLPSPELDTWWTGFDHPELTRIVERVLNQNLDLAESFTRMEQARAAAKGAGAKLKPSGSVSAQSSSFRQSLDSPIGRYATALPAFHRNQSYLDLGLEASWEVDLSVDLGEALKQQATKPRQPRQKDSEFVFP